MRRSDLSREWAHAVDGIGFAGVRGQARSHRDRAVFSDSNKTVAST